MLLTYYSPAPSVLAQTRDPLGQRCPAIYCGVRDFEDWHDASAYVGGRVLIWWSQKGLWGGSDME